MTNRLELLLQNRQNRSAITCRTTDPGMFAGYRHVAISPSHLVLIEEILCLRCGSATNE